MIVLDRRAQRFDSGRTESGVVHRRRIQILLRVTGTGESNETCEQCRHCQREIMILRPSLASRILGHCRVLCMTIESHPRRFFATGRSPSSAARLGRLSRAKSGSRLLWGSLFTDASWNRLCWPESDLGWLKDTIELGTRLAL